MDVAEIIGDIIKNKSGFIVEICGLYVGKKKNGRYHVVCDREDCKFREEFTDPHRAAIFFVRKKLELKLGFSENT